jgi:predicted phosphate transport protein (TIGR00153 family)
MRLSLSSLIPREEKFHDMFEEFTGTLVRAGDKFLELVTEFDKVPERCKELKDIEERCDAMVAGIMAALSRSFITPFDREDIHALGKALDDIMDNMEETANRFLIFRLEKPTTSAIALAKIVRDCCQRLNDIVRLCRTMKDVEKLNAHIREVSRLESEADAVYRDVESSLFANPPDVLTLIKLREVYGWLEDTVDSCQVASDVLSEIVIKEA